MNPKRVYRTRKEAEKACKPDEYARKTLPWRHEKGYICAKRTYWMKGKEAKKEVK